MTYDGSDGDDIIVGADGDDVLDGKAGDDEIDGGEGDDTLTGDDGDDTFVFASEFGNDVVVDFEAGDIVEFRQVTAISSYADVLVNAADDGTDTTITVDADNSIVLENVLVSELSSDDFRFA
ncbi:MAG: calcium-binding protein, partial [Hyphomicrobiales bacterium]|nr:calcium-binding protein [Hyphomicrobiales bacterium]